MDDNGIEKIVENIVNTYTGDMGINFIDVANLPLRDKILEILNLLLEVLFPGYTGKTSVTQANIPFIVSDILCKTRDDLTEQAERAFRYQCRMEQCTGCDCRKMAEDVTKHLIAALPKIRGSLKGDVKAAYEGDPAAKSFESTRTPPRKASSNTKSPSFVTASTPARVTA